MASILFEWQQGNLPSTVKINARGGGQEHCKAIVLRSGKKLKAPIKIEKTCKEENKEASPTQVLIKGKIEDNVEVKT